jgi:hypothetical protein
MRIGLGMNFIWPRKNEPDAMNRPTDIRQRWRATRRDESCHEGDEPSRDVKREGEKRQPGRRRKGQAIAHCSTSKRGSYGFPIRCAGALVSGASPVAGG